MFGLFPTLICSSLWISAMMATGAVAARPMPLHPLMEVMMMLMAAQILLWQ
jgi:hypothetical protein